MSALRLRSVTLADAKLLLSWRNDETVRRSAFASEEIEWPPHERWFTKKLSSSSTRIWILEQDGQPVGQVRYELSGEIAEISFSVAREFRGQGFGVDLLSRSAPLACQELKPSKLVGFVKVDNIASSGAFERAGFERAARCKWKGAECNRYEKACLECG